MAFTNLDFTTFTFTYYAQPSVQEELIKWALEEPNESKAFKILKALRKINKRIK